MILGLLEQSRDPLAHGALGIALGLEDHVRPSRQLPRLLQAHLMDLLGGEGGGGGGAQGVLVIGLPIGQAPDAGVVHGAGSQLSHQGDLSFQGRPHLVHIDG